MKQVKGYTKEDYVKQCVEEGGTPVEYKDMAEASDALAAILKERGRTGLTLAEIADRIIDDTNCDWLLMEDGTVLFRDYRHMKPKNAPRCYGSMFKEDGNLAYGSMICDAEFCDFSEECWKDSRAAGVSVCK